MIIKVTPNFVYTYRIFFGGGNLILIQSNSLGAMWNHFDSPYDFIEMFGDGK